MKRDEIIVETTKIFQDTFNNNEITLCEEMTADDVDKWDSLTNTLLVSNIEKHFSIKFKIREIVKMKNVGALIDTIENKLS